MNPGFFVELKTEGGFFFFAMLNEALQVNTLTNRSLSG